MKNYFVIADVNNISYMVKVSAESLAGAEHFIIDKGYCGKHTYGVTAAMAFDTKSMKTDTFIGMAIDAKLIALDDFEKIIDERNEEIKNADEKERRINELKKAIKSMSDELNELFNN